MWYESTHKIRFCYLCKKQNISARVVKLTEIKLDINFKLAVTFNDIRTATYKAKHI